MKHRINWFVGLVFLCMAGLSVAGQNDAHRVTYSSKDSFEIVKSSVMDAIAGKGLVINATSHIGDMLERTGKDLGKTTQVFLHAEALEFCSSTVSRMTMEADPHNIVFCPYVIAIYVLPNEPNKTYVSFRKPIPVGSKASRDSLKEVEKLLRSIVEEAVQ